MNTADRIEKLIRAGATVADVVKKLKVSKSYVYVVIHARMGKTENLKVKKAKQPIDTRAQEWAKKNPWFGKDKDKTAFALRMHEKLVKKGVDPKSAEYYKKVDASLRYFDTQKKESWPVEIKEGLKDGRQLIKQLKDKLFGREGFYEKGAAKFEKIKEDMVNHPPHYKIGGIEVIDFIEAKGFGYNLGNVVKYIARAGKKGSTLEDLQKARWYLNREIESAK